MNDFLFDGPIGATSTIALTHGAGAPVDSQFMQFSRNAWRQRFSRCRFEFPTWRNAGEAEKSRRTGCHS